MKTPKRTCAWYFFSCLYHRPCPGIQHRREIGTILGDQIWIMNADGSAAFALSNSSGAIHDGLSWSPDGKYLLIHTYLLDKPLSEPVMFMINI